MGLGHLPKSKRICKRSCHHLRHRPRRMRTLGSEVGKRYVLREKCRMTKKEGSRVDEVAGGKGGFGSGAKNFTVPPFVGPPVIPEETVRNVHYFSRIEMLEQQAQMCALGLSCPPLLVLVFSRHELPTTTGIIGASSSKIRDERKGRRQLLKFSGKRLCFRCVQRETPLPLLESDHSFYEVLLDVVPPKSPFHWFVFRRPSSSLSSRASEQSWGLMSSSQELQVFIATHPLYIQSNLKILLP